MYATTREQLRIFVSANTKYFNSPLSDNITVKWNFFYQTLQTSSFFYFFVKNTIDGAKPISCVCFRQLSPL